MKKRIISNLEPGRCLLGKEIGGTGDKTEINERQGNSGKSIHLPRQPTLEYNPQIQAKKHTEV
jgi:hypothetical protein